MANNKRRNWKKSYIDGGCDKILSKDNNVIDNKNDICNHFNDFFVNVALELTKDLQCSIGESLTYLKQYIPNHFDNRFILKPINITQVIEIIRRMKSKKSNDLWYITPCMLKKLEKEIAAPLMITINECIENCYYPDEMKLSKVVPLHKKGETTSCNNYRPVSVLPSISKVFEKYLADELVSYMSNNQLFNSRQFGFQKGKSTKHAIMRLIQDVFSGLERAQKTYAVFCDLSKAFDCVSHDILLRKLEHYGIVNNELNILQSYLTNRFQLTEINGCRSHQSSVKIGVPQGSILGPLLFLIYINDISTVFNDNIDIILFADDTSLVVKDKTNDGISAKFNKVVPDLMKWFSANNLVLNIDKTYAMQFSLGSRSKKELPDCVQDTFEELSLSCTDHIKFLGVWIDTKLTWAVHITNIAKKLSSATYAIKKIKELGGMQAARDTYFAYFHSIMTYGIIFWGVAADASRVFILQKRAVRYILGLKPTHSCREKFKELNIMTMVGEFIYQNIVYVRENLGSMILKKDVHRFNTRHKNDIILHQTRLSKIAKSYICVSIKLYNKIPLDIRNKTDIEFKNYIKRHLVSKSYYKLDEAFADKELFLPNQIIH